MRFFSLCLKALALLSGAFVALGIYSAWVIWWYKPALTPSRPFPNQVKGRSIVWVPDEEVRSMVRGLSEKDVASLSLLGGTGRMPSHLSVTDKSLIRMFLIGMRKAVRSADAPLEFTGVEHDVCSIILSNASDDKRSRSFIFTTDVIDGERRMMMRGTVSPEFQDALRMAGVPPPQKAPGHNTLAEIIYLMWLENGGR